VDGITTDELTLADWRRRVAALYVDVRRLLPADPDEALARWRREREALYRHHPQSPVPAAAQGAFRALHFPTDPSLRFDVRVEPDAPADAQATGSAAVASAGLGAFGAAPLLLPISDGGGMQLRRIGFVAVPFPAGTRRLAVFWMAGYAGGLFLPFRDATNGRETYAAGRYLLDGAKSADLGGDPDAGTLHLDFNFAYQPSCAFDPRWACPLAPPENWLDLPIRAGERIA
jgi:uncharacterized protein (DUF1684 family)